MKTYMVIVSFWVEAENEEGAVREASNTVFDPSLVVESVTEMPDEQDA